jgi:hypothetical protein
MSATICPAALMREAVLRLAAAVQPAIAADIIAGMRRGPIRPTQLEPSAIGHTPRKTIAPVWSHPTDEERAWCAEQRAAMTLPPRNEGTRR